MTTQNDYLNERIARARIDEQVTRHARSRRPRHPRIAGAMRNLAERLDPS